MKVSVRNLMCGLLLFYLGGVTFAGLIAPLGGAVSIAVVVENGFDLMSMKSTFFPQGGAGVILLGIYCILQYLLGIAAMIIGVCAVFSPKAARAQTGMAIAVFAAQTVYAAVGIAYACITKANHDVFCTTYAYLPFIFGAVLFTAFCICKRSVSDKALCESGAVPDGKATFDTITEAEKKRRDLCACDTEKERLELLEGYGKLCRDGVLTEEEFAAKKKQILNG